MTDPTDLLAADEPSLADDVARLNRWLDREHNRFPSSPLAAPTARVLSALTTATDEAQRLRAALRELLGHYEIAAVMPEATGKAYVLSLFSPPLEAARLALAPKEPTDAD